MMFDQGLTPTFSNGLGRWSVNGRNALARPAARTMAIIAECRDAQVHEQMVQAVQRGWRPLTPTT